ncbi:hypothetical protein KC678_02245 [Candidatus Dojkabacteria bacterium]|uniref:Uncharacterized protein n=1 Tax=Candidatus Dojkabacteria bacterium TaxID=2099670 RepID=A0A955I8Y2_9BACT|nr:hypothetical protein [Candidatus Dojkabacteria bacterium]
MNILSPNIYSPEKGFGSVRNIIFEIEDPEQRFLYHAFLSRYFRPLNEFDDPHRKTLPVNKLESGKELGQIFRPGSSVKSVLKMYDEILADECNYPLSHSFTTEM